MKFMYFSIKYIEDIQIFGMNMPFMSSIEARNAYFMSGECIFHEWRSHE